MKLEIGDGHDLEVGREELASEMSVTIKQLSEGKLLLASGDVFLLIWKQ